MHIDRISYQNIFPTGMMYLNHKIGVEIELDETDDAREVFLKAKSIVEGWNAETNPSMAVTMDYFKQPIAETNLDKEKLEIKIDNCTSKPELQLLQNDAFKYNLVEHYLNKLKSFQ